MKAPKGTKGYRNARKKKLVVWLCLCGAAIIAQLAARSLTSVEAVKNILTVMAVLSVLPTANLAAPLLASWRFGQPDESFYTEMKPFESKAEILYELIITSKEFILPADAAAVHPQGVFIYCSNEKIDTGKAEQFLNGMLKEQKLDPNAKVIKDRKAFYRRLENLKPASEYEDDGSGAYAVALLKSLSM